MGHLQYILPKKQWLLCTILHSIIIMSKLLMFRNACFTFWYMILKFSPISAPPPCKYTLCAASASPPWCFFRPPIRLITFRSSILVVEEMAALFLLHFLPYKEKCFVTSPVFKGRSRRFQSEAYHKDVS